MASRPFQLFAARKILFNGLICLVILGIGLLAMNGLAALKRAPVQQEAQERVLAVQAITARAENVRVQVIGYGQVQAVDSVQIAPEISGRIASLHPRLEAGEVIPKGETLFVIDEASFLAEYREAEALVSQRLQEIERLRLQMRLDRERLQTLKRNVELSQAEFDRLSRLHGRAAMATQSEVDRAEQALNTARERFDQLEQTVKLAPIRISETEQALQAARAGRDLARTDLQRCRVSAPFTGRLTNVALERGQYVAPGQNLLTLADDSLLEIRVPVDSREARQWLRFKKHNGLGSRGWFPGLEPVECRIRWTEDEAGGFWTGHLHRPVRFDEQNRTLTVAVRVSGREASRGGRDGLPLVEGMFCEVSIPGRLLESVYRIPRQAVSFEQTVYLAENGRLKTVAVEVARMQGEAAFISKGISERDRVITTRLVDPLESSRVDILENEASESRS